ncbi:HEAT repeat domain-containing protein [Weeksellaceae bacterium Sa1CVA4]|uniref:HEAT repeat domain-containing protein n=2 Tax=Kaistella pullorum TaxID=2763074 RepID=A0ABR8WPZ1_9FLAO|nr:HEAT repeat domain-containing protein [Kaistella pullorum]
MTTTIKKILPYFLTSIFVVGLWWVLTWTNNYAWNPVGKELLMLEIALISIFYYKTLFWLVIANVTVFTVRQLMRKNYKTTAISALLTISFYFFVGQVVDKKCAFHYYSVFHNQSVSEEYIDRPILEAGYQIGPIITENIADKEMKYRRYAIGGLEKIKYKPATPTLTKILLDKSELEVFRADAYEALTAFDTEETRKILTDFENQATDSLDKKVVELGEYFINNK